MTRNRQVGRFTVFTALALLVLAVPTARAETHVFVQLGIPAPVQPVLVAPPLAVPPPPAYGLVWRPAHYVWTGYGYAWVPGAWVRPAYARPYSSWNRGHRDWDRDEHWRHHERVHRRDWDRDRDRGRRDWDRER